MSDQLLRLAIGMLAVVILLLVTCLIGLALLIERWDDVTLIGTCVG
jgi:hypothetical protein